MRGHIVRRGKRPNFRYYVVIDNGRDPGTAKRRQSWHSGFRTKIEAEGALAKLVTQMGDGSYVAPNNQTLGSFLVDEWLPGIRSQIRPGTLSLYETCVSAYVLPHVGEVSLQNLSASMLNRLYATLLERGGRDGRALAPKTVRNVHTLLHRALRDASRWGKLSRNVADLADPPKAGAPEMRTWGADELGAFLEHVHRDRLYAGWLLIATTGLRRGEALGLRWDDVDLKTGRAAIRSTLVLVDSVPTFSKPKTAKGNGLSRWRPKRWPPLRHTGLLSSRSGLPWEPDTSTKDWSSLGRTAQRFTPRPSQPLSSATSVARASP